MPNATRAPQANQSVRRLRRLLAQFLGAQGAREMCAAGKPAGRRIAAVRNPRSASSFGARARRIACNLADARRANRARIARCLRRAPARPSVWREREIPGSCGASLSAPRSASSPRYKRDFTSKWNAEHSRHLLDLQFFLEAQHETSR